MLVRSRPTLAALAGAPVAVLLAFLVLLGLGAFDPARPGASFWVVFGGFFVGLAYGLPQIRPELGTLRAERFCGLSPGAYVLAKAAVLVPPLAVADAVILLAPGLSGRLDDGGYGPVFVTLLLSSAVALGLGLLLSAVAPGAAARADPGRRLLPAAGPAGGGRADPAAPPGLGELAGAGGVPGGAAGRHDRDHLPSAAVDRRGLAARL